MCADDDTVWVITMRYCQHFAWAPLERKTTHIYGLVKGLKENTRNIFFTLIPVVYSVFMVHFVYFHNRAIASPEHQNHGQDYFFPQR